MSRALTAAVLMLLPALAACGSDQERYCALVEERQEELSEIAADHGRIFDSLPIARELRAAAPDDIEPDWGVVIAALEELQAAVEEAGVDADYDAQHPPPGLSRAHRQEIAAAALRLGGQRVVSAMSSLEQHALDVCTVPLTR